MRLSIREDTDKLMIIELAGELDIAGVRQVETHFLALAAAGHKSVLLDMAKVTFLGSFGIRMILDAYKSLERRQQKLVILNPSPSVEKVFAAAGLNDVLMTLHDEGEARDIVCGP